MRPLVAVVRHIRLWMRTNPLHGMAIPIYSIINIGVALLVEFLCQTKPPIVMESWTVTPSLSMAPWTSTNICGQAATPKDVSALLLERQSRDAGRDSTKRPSLPAFFMTLSPRSPPFVNIPTSAPFTIQVLAVMSSNQTPPATPGTMPVESSHGTPATAWTPTESASGTTRWKGAVNRGDNMELTPPRTPSCNDKYLAPTKHNVSEPSQRPLPPRTGQGRVREKYDDDPFDISTEKEVVVMKQDKAQGQYEYSSEPETMMMALTITEGRSEAETVSSSSLFHDAALQKVMSDAYKLAGSVWKALAKCPMGSEVSCVKLQAEALALSYYEMPVTRLIGVIGQSGHGKSSLINSLLDVDGLAITGEIGSAVTAFPIEYAHKTREQTSDFTVTATFLTSEEINEHLGELLQDYRRPALAGLEELTPTEHEAAENRSETARNIFEAAFSSMDSFDLKSLDYTGEEEHTKALSLLHSWAASLRWPPNLQDGKWQGVANTTSQCANLVNNFVDQGLWPFLKEMRVYLESPVLRDGIVLADLPGYHDVNFARIRSAQQYQSKCDELFVVANIGRAIDNPIIQDVLRPYKTAASGVGKVATPSITVVCTHSADLTERRKLEKAVDPQKLAKAKALQADIDQRTFKGADARKAIRDADLNLISLLIEARNSNVINGLQEAYADYFAPSTLPVFCVDNYLYQKKYSTASTNVSGIPSLRQYCFGLMEKALFKATDIFLTTRIPALINSLELWIEASKCNTEIDQGLIDLDSEDLCNSLEKLVQAWEEDMNEEIVSAIKPLRRKIKMITDANFVTCASWNAMHHSSHKAFINHNGTHETKSVGFRCWNTELIQNMNKYSAKRWSDLDADAEARLEALCKTSMDDIGHFQNKAIEAKAPKAFLRNLKAWKRCLQHSQDLSVRKFLEQLRRIKYNATSGHAASYVMSYMRPVYQECQNDYGESCRSLISLHLPI
jgi:Dynamin family